MYLCAGCDQKFVSYYNYVYHVCKIRTCPKCNKTFTTPFSLKVHVQAHLNIRPHKCEICEMAFTQKNNLNKHKLIHTGEKPYRCEICTKQFARSYSLKAHIKICKSPLNFEL